MGVAIVPTTHRPQPRPHQGEFLRISRLSSLRVRDTRLYRLANMVASGGQFTQPLGMWAIQNDIFLEGQKFASEVALRSERKQNAELQKLLEKAHVELRSSHENNENYENLNGSSNSSNNSSASTTASPG